LIQVLNGHCPEVLLFWGRFKFLGIVNGGNFDCHLGNEGGRGEVGKVFSFPIPAQPPSANPNKLGFFVLGIFRLLASLGV